MRHAIALRFIVPITRHVVTWCGAWVLLLGQTPVLSGQAGSSAVEFRWNRYHTYDEVTAYVRDLAERHPQLVTLESAGRSTMKRRDIWVLTITNANTGPASDKPAFFLDGGTHAGEFGGSETALYTAWYLATQYGRDAAVTHLLDTRAVYVMPRKDVDGMEVQLTGKLDYDPARTPGAMDRDDDGRKGEDGPDDADGDGMVLQMRVPDPDGEWVMSRADPRLMVARAPGDAGPFYRVMPEGTDEDGDGRVNEDPPQIGFSSNRNYPARWTNETGTQRGQGDYPVQEVETRATVEFVTAHRNIGGMQSLHHYAGAILRPFSNLPADRFPLHDRVYYDAIAARGREITGYGYIDVFEDFTGNKDAPRFGVQLDWGYLHVGAVTFTTEQWRYIGNIGPVGAWRDQTPEEQLATNDTRFGGRHFVRWKRFAHPHLRDVEIGGWVPFSIRNPPPDLMEREMLEPNMRFILHHASMLPRVRIDDVRVIPVAGVYRVVASIINQGFLPTNVTEQARRAGLAVPVTARLDVGGGVSLVSSQRQQPLGHLEGKPAVVKTYSFGSQSFGGTNRRTVEWVVAGAGEVTVRVQSQKGGADQRTVRVP